MKNQLFLGLKQEMNQMSLEILSYLLFNREAIKDQWGYVKKTQELPDETPLFKDGVI